MTMQFYRPILLSFLGLSIAIGTFHSVTSIAQAQPTAAKKRRYVPPKRAMPRRTEAGGTRGDNCVSGQSDTQLTLLVPQEVMAHAHNSHPTFSWHIQTSSPTTTIPVRFALIKPGQATPIYQQTLQQQGSGLMQLQLPDNLPALEMNQPYRWMVSLSCGSDRPSEQLYQRAWIERVPLSPTATQALAQTSQISDRLTIYAQDGIWYESIAIAVAQQQDPAIQPLWQQLLADAQLDSQLNPTTTNLAQQPQAQQP